MQWKEKSRRIQRGLWIYNRNSTFCVPLGLGLDRLAAASDSCGLVNSWHKHGSLEHQIIDCISSNTSDSIHLILLTARTLSFGRHVRGNKTLPLILIPSFFSLSGWPQIRSHSRARQHISQFGNNSTKAYRSGAFISASVGLSLNYKCDGEWKGERRESWSDARGFVPNTNYSAMCPSSPSLQEAKLLSKNPALA